MAYMLERPRRKKERRGGRSKGKGERERRNNLLISSSISLFSNKN